MLVRTAFANVIGNVDGTMDGSTSTGAVDAEDIVADFAAEVELCAEDEDVLLLFHFLFDPVARIRLLSYSEFVLRPILRHPCLLIVRFSLRQVN